MGRDWRIVGRPEYLRGQTELNLRHLGAERIDLLQLHRIDPAVPLADQVGELALLREEGKVRHIGLSEVSVEQIEQARAITPITEIARRRGVSPGQPALAWLLRRSPVILPIPGTSRVSQLQENVTAAGIELDDDEFAALEHAAGAQHPPHRACARGRVPRRPQMHYSELAVQFRNEDMR